MSNTLSTSQLSLNEAFELYENGKHRRYSLLFAVNGGAFAVAKLLSGAAGEAAERSAVLGNLSLFELSIGMALFTALMIVDIFLFGARMRAQFLPDAFGLPGKLVLILLGILQCSGWLLIGSA
ncbi:MAG TPA: hypothetical protein VGN07_16850 [Steroidobacteraceae bacterium]|jgi:hypothetical protein